MAKEEMNLHRAILERRDGNDERCIPGRGSSIQDGGKREPCRILSLNAQGLIYKDTKWKVDMLK